MRRFATAIGPWALLGSAVLLAAQSARSTSEAKATPGMGVIARGAKSAPVLPKILAGEIPATIDAEETFRDPAGEISTYRTTGATVSAQNGFFSNAITTNGRTCFTCHQPENDWEISPPQIQAQLMRTRGRSALFQPVDAADCPNIAGATAPFSDPSFVAARSQLLKRGNFRISLNAPNPLGPNDDSYVTFGGNTNPEWVLTVEYDPFNCELDAQYGLPANLLSVYRRPLPATNVAFLGQDGTTPDKFDIMWDAREPDLRTQFINATLFHGQTNVEPSASLVTQGVEFQSRMFTAQTLDFWAGDLTGAGLDGALGGPTNLYNWRQSVSPLCVTQPDGLVCAGIKEKMLTDDGTRVNRASELYTAFATSSDRSSSRRAQRESIARGESLFSTRVFTIANVAGLNDIKGSTDGEPGTCSTCHSNKNVGNDTANDPKRLGIMDNSSNVLPPTPDFPLFAFYCPTDSIPFFSNPVTSSHCPGSTATFDATCDEFITTDPGKGLITGHCKDLGKMKVPVLRGAAARAPYFHGGNAATLLDVVNFYDARFSIGLSEQEKSDLVNYLNAL